MARAHSNTRTRVSVAALLTAVVSTAIVGTGLVAAAPASAATSSLPALHGMGLQRTGVTVTPAAGLRSLATIAPAATLPVSVDLTRYAEKVGDQGEVNSCATWAIGYAMMGWFARSQGHAGAPYAPMYVYAQVDGGKNAGSSAMDVFEVLRTQGIDTAAHYAAGHRHSTLDWRHLPSIAERASAAANKITGWVTLYNTWGTPGSIGVTALKRTLASGRPVALGIAVYAHFMNADATHSLVTLNGNLGTLLGYHEVLALGYDSRGLRIENSWGTGWGDKGYATLDWNYVAQHSFEAETMGGLVTTTGRNRPAVAAVSPAKGGVVTVTGSKLNSALVTLGRWTFAPIAVSGDGKVMTFQVPNGTSARGALTVSTPGGISAARTYQLAR